MEGIESTMGELKQIKDVQEITFGHKERRVGQLSIDMDQFKVGEECTLADMERSDEILCTTSDAEQCKDVRESALTDMEESDDQLNEAEDEVERGELFNFYKTSSVS